MRHENLVLHLSRIQPNSAVASTRIAQYMADLLNAPLYHHLPQFEATPDVSCKTLFLVNSIGRFCAFHKYLQPLTEAADRIVWINNDYSSHMTFNTQLRFGVIHAKKPVMVWTTIPDRVRGPYDHYVNWNALMWQPLPLVDHSVDGLFYYGAYREGRIKSFKRYFSDPLPYGVTISTPRLVDRKFQQLNPNTLCVPTFNGLADLQKYQMSIYIHDEKHNTEYGSPANRFYECASAGLPLVFDSNTVGTFKRAGYDVSRYAVSSKEDVVSALKHSKEFQTNQRKEWSGVDYQGILRQQVNEALQKLDLSYKTGIEYRRPYGCVFVTKDEWEKIQSKKKTAMVSNVDF